MANGREVNTLDWIKQRRYSTFLILDEQNDKMKNKKNNATIKIKHLLVCEPDIIVLWIETLLATKSCFIGCRLGCLHLGQQHRCRYVFSK